MNKGLSKREKVLIFIATVLVVAFVGGWLIGVPLHERYMEKQAVYEQLLADKEVMDTKFLNEPLTRAQLTAGENAYALLEERYPSCLSNIDVERILVDLDHQHNLRPEALNMSGDLYYAKSREQAKANEETTADTESGDEEHTTYGLITASTRLRGNFDGLQGLMRVVEQTEYMRISQLNFSHNETGELDISVSFEIMTLDRE